MSNPWLDAYDQRINFNIFKMNEYHMKGSYGGDVDFQEIIQVLRGACNEIKNLQKENDKLKTEYKILLEKSNTDIIEG